jgi:hypothetical protein
MAQIFPKSANEIAKASILAIPVLAIGLFLGWTVFMRSPYITNQKIARSQPVPFSHKHHVGGLGLDCRYCHTSVEVSSTAGIPPTKTCMNCHSQIWTNAQILEPVRYSYRSGTSLQWEKVNDLPDFVYFNHSIHVNKGVGCNTCHGQVDGMALTLQQESLQMEWCLECHRAPEKNLRPREEVFNMTYQQPTEAHPVKVDGKEFTTQAELGAALVHKYNLRSVRDITSCSTCHR